MHSSRAATGYEAQAADTPLGGVRVLDLTQFLSGPYCTQMLADLGAEIIKVEAPQGDLARSIPPHMVGEDSVYYLSINRSKRSVAIDIKTEAGLALVRRLALASDVVVENFRPGVLPRLGLDAAELLKAKPQLVWCSISGFGQDGPYSRKPAYDMIVQALSGGMSLTGEVNGAPVRAGIPIGDISAGLYASTAILAALRRAEATGKGDIIDISMLDCQAAMLSYQAAYYLHSGQVPGRQGSAHDSIATYRGFPTRDGVGLVITANTERMWAGLCRVLGVEALATDPRFANNRVRQANRTQLWPLLEAAFMTRDADDWVPLLEAEGVPVGVVNTLDRVMDDPHVRYRGMIAEIDAPDGRSVRVMGNPMKFASAAMAEATFPPRLGEDTLAVLGEILSLSPEAAAELVQAGVLLDAGSDAPETKPADPARSGTAPVDG